MAHAQQIKKHAHKLRRAGQSIPRIARSLGIAKSTISLWVQDIRLPERLLKHLKDRSVHGRERGLAIIQARYHERALAYQKRGKEIANSMVKKTDKNFWQVCAALLFWCEGGKRTLRSGVCFMNSDPALAALFLYALRHAFALDENKFRAHVHLHEYHNEKQQLRFWSSVTNIPLVQFRKSYQKPHTKIRQREGYPGCISIRYGDASLARTLDAVYHAFGKKYGPVG